jgi:hypothetical protein
MDISAKVLLGEGEGSRAAEADASGTPKAASGVVGGKVVYCHGNCWK